MVTSVARLVLPKCWCKVMMVRFICCLRCLRNGGKLVKAVLRSETGGNLRLRSYWKLAAEEALLKQKKEEEANPNALFKVQQISRPMISEKAPLKGVALRDTYLYDVDTREGEVIIVTVK